MWRLGLWAKETCCRKGGERRVGGAVVVGVDVCEMPFSGSSMGKNG